MIELQTLYQNTLKFAAGKHAAQTIPGTQLSYVVHISNVTMEILIAYQKAPTFNIEFAVQVALLHDVLEDTETTFHELVQQFNSDVADAVLALTKNSKLPKEEKMNDSLARIKKLSKEVSMVKLADRITNLQPPPPHWDSQKIAAYQKEAIQIFNALKGANTYLEERLWDKSQQYLKYV